MALAARLLCWLALGLASASLPLPTLPPLPPLPSLPLPAIPPASQPQPQPAPAPSVQLPPPPVLPVPADLSSLAPAESDDSLPSDGGVDDLGPRSSSRYRAGSVSATGSQHLTAAAFSGTEPVAASPRPAACPVLGFPTSNSSCPQVQIPGLALTGTNFLLGLLAGVLLGLTGMLAAVRRRGARVVRPD